MIKWIKVICIMFDLLFQSKKNVAWTMPGILPANFFSYPRGISISYRRICSEHDRSLTEKIYQPQVNLKYTVNNDPCSENLNHSVRVDFHKSIIRPKIEFIYVWTVQPSIPKVDSIQILYIFLLQDSRYQITISMASIQISYIH